MQGRRAGDIPPRVRQAGDKPVSDWIRGRQHDDRDSVGRVLRRAGHGGSAQGHNEIDLTLDQLGGQRGELRDVALRVAELDDEILALHPAEVAQAVAEGLKIAGQIRPI
jgi:hypothetical protein